MGHTASTAKSEKLPSVIVPPSRGQPSSEPLPIIAPTSPLRRPSRNFIGAAANSASSVLGPSSSSSGHAGDTTHQPPPHQQPLENIFHSPRINGDSNSNNISRVRQNIESVLAARQRQPQSGESAAMVVTYRPPPPRNLNPVSDLRRGLITSPRRSDTSCPGPTGPCPPSSSAPLPQRDGSRRGAAPFSPSPPPRQSGTSLPSSGRCSLTGAMFAPPGVVRSPSQPLHQSASAQPSEEEQPAALSSKPSMMSFLSNPVAPSPTALRPHQLMAARAPPPPAKPVAIPAALVPHDFLFHHHTATTMAPTTTTMEMNPFQVEKGIFDLSSLSASPTSVSLPRGDLPIPRRASVLAATEGSAQPLVGFVRSPVSSSSPQEQQVAVPVSGEDITSPTASSGDAFGPMTVSIKATKADEASLPRQYCSDESTSMLPQPPPTTVTDVSSPLRATFSPAPPSPPLPIPITASGTNLGSFQRRNSRTYENADLHRQVSGGARSRSTSPSAHPTAAPMSDISSEFYHVSLHRVDGSCSYLNQHGSFVSAGRSGVGSSQKHLGQGGTSGAGMAPVDGSSSLCTTRASFAGRCSPRGSVTFDRSAIVLSGRPSMETLTSTTTSNQTHQQHLCSNPSMLVLATQNNTNIGPNFDAIDNISYSGPQPPHATETPKEMHDLQRVNKERSDSSQHHHSANGEFYSMVGWCGLSGGMPSATQHIGSDGGAGVAGEEFFVVPLQSETHHSNQLARRSRK